MRPRKIKMDTAILPTIFFLHKHTMPAANPILEKENQPNDSSASGIRPIRLWYFIGAILFTAVFELILIQVFKILLPPSESLDSVCFVTYFIALVIQIPGFIAGLIIFVITIKQISIRKAICTAFSIFGMLIMIVINYRLFLAVSPTLWLQICPVLGSIPSFIIHMKAVVAKKKKNEELV